jgi:PAS domain S-box-containing protein/putative nucleotidyltransferase with HDIG domain
LKARDLLIDLQDGSRKKSVPMSDRVRILIVEDQPTDAQLAVREIRRALPDSVFECVDTETDFVQKMEEFDPHLILADFHLPHFTGLRALEIVKERGLPTPLIIMTGSRSEDVAVECMQAGAANYIIKDNFKRLGTAVIHALEEARAHVERQRAEQALRENMEVFNGFLEQSADAVLLTNEQGLVVQWSKGAERLTGYSRQETIGRALWDVQFRAVPDKLKSTQNYEHLKTSLQSALLSGRGVFLDRLLETTLQRGDGNLVTVQTSAFSIKTQTGFILGGIMRDLTERRQAEEAVKASEARFRGMFEDSPAALWVEDFSAVTARIDAWRKDGTTDFRDFFESHPEATVECASLVKILDVNRATMQMMGASRKEQLLGSLDELFDHKPSATFGDQLVGLASGKNRYHTETVNKTLDGRLIDVDMNWSTAPGSEISLATVIVSMIDITERKQAEALQKAVYRIAGAAVTARSLDDLYADIHRIISGVMHAENFYITLYDSERDLLTFPYFRDEVDEPYINEVHPERGLTAYVLRTGKSLLCTQAVHDELERQGEVKLLGAPSSIWLGVPLLVGGKAIGAMVVQHYSNPAAYTEREQHMLEFVSAQVATAIQSKQAEQALQDSHNRFRALIENSADAITLLDVQGRVLYDSPSAPGLLGYSPDDWIGRQVFTLIHPDDLLRIQGILESIVKEPGARVNSVFRLQHTSGAWLWIEAVATNLLNEPGVNAIVVNYHDISARKQAEEAVSLSEERFRELYENNTLGMYRTTPDGRILLANPTLVRMLGFDSFEELSARNLEESGFEPTYARSQFLKTIQEAGEVRGLEAAWQRRDRTYLFIRESARATLDADGQILYLDGTVEDISARKQAEAALEASEQHLRSLFENMLNGYARCQMIYEDGRPTDFIYLDVNKAFERLTGLKDVISKKVTELIPGVRETNPELLELYGRVAATGHSESVETYVPGLSIWFSISAYSFHKDEFVAVFDNITERKRAEVESRALLEIMQAAALTESLPEFLEFLRQSLARVLDAENLFVVFHDERTGLFQEIFAVDKYDEPMPPSSLEKSITSYVFRSNQPLLLTQAKFAELQAQGEVELVGTQQASWLGAPLKTPAGTIGVIAVQNYEDPDRYSEHDRDFLASIAGQVALAIQRRRAEDALRQSQERFQKYFELGLIGMAISSPAKGLLEVNDQMCSMLGYDREELLRIPWSDITHPDDLASDVAQFNRVLAGEIDGYSLEKRWIRKDGQIVDSSLSVKGVRNRDGSLEYFVALVQDITDRKRAAERIENQIHRMSALRAIDAAISSSLDLRVSLNILLSQATTELHVDAAAVLLLNNLTNELEYSAGSGFRGTGMAQVRLKLGAAYAGQAALERRMISVPDLAEARGPLSNTTVIVEEMFVSYYAVPLVAKGQVKGVLELYHRTRLDPDPEWLDFLGSLAGQAAIAIDSSQLFAELQRSNIELALAYDSTIEGWSQAMDLRDKETEGHTQRVTQAAVKLARAMGLSEQELTHLRRGALLHDIGKMGVPDAILLKPGPLTEEEWASMKQHPTLAFQMLSQVRHLQPAIGIPYCHHEKWDGTGYPRGLRGEQIPLPARIFAVIDVYDALTSDRPYRPAWSAEKTQEYIRSQSGTHFDPRVVDAFLSMKATAEPLP